MNTVPLQGSRPGKNLVQPQGFALFALGFRPFFALAGVSAACLLLLWLLMWSGHLAPSGHYGSVGWHSHEMLFGYGMAVVAGFLLTAVRNWTGVDTATGWRLALLAGIWLAGRLVSLGEMPGMLVSLIDLAFVPALGVALYKPLMLGRQKSNRMFLLFIAGMFAANLCVHLDALGLAPGWAARGTDLMLDTVLLLIILVSGRIMPFFTGKAVPASSPRNLPWLEMGSINLMLIFMLSHQLSAQFGMGFVHGMLAMGMALLQALRLANWHHPGVWRIPILWVLYAGYLWLIAGFLLTGLTGFGLFIPSLAVHAFTLGGIGVLTLGMMARVTLGHTGRGMRSSLLVNLSFVLLNLAAATRVFAPMLGGDYARWVQISGHVWITAFILFVVTHLHMWLRPRVDGMPG